MSEQDIAVFKASIPPIQTAIRVSGDGNGVRLLLDIPEIEMDAVTLLLGMRRAELIVTIQVAQGLKEFNENGSAEINKRSTASPTRMVRRRVRRPTD